MESQTRDGKAMGLHIAAETVEVRRVDFTTALLVASDFGFALLSQLRRSYPILLHRRYLASLLNL